MKNNKQNQSLGSKICKDILKYICSISPEAADLAAYKACIKSDNAIKCAVQAKLAMSEAALAYSRSHRERNRMGDLFGTAYREKNLAVRRATRAKRKAKEAINKYVALKERKILLESIIKTIKAHG